MHRSHVFWLLLVLVSTEANARNKHKKDKRVEVPQHIGPTMAPASNVFLRNSFDMDPSRYIGRFLPPDDAPLDETSSIKRDCSQYIEQTVIESGGTQREELFRSSDTAALSVGVPPLIGGDASGGRQSAVLIRYTETHKMVSDISDPAAFEACCADPRSHCTSRYVSEFIEGTGEIFYSAGTEADFNAGLVTPEIGADLEIKHGMAWHKATVFDTPVYFAFKVSPVGFATPTPTDGCPDWVNNPPRGTDRQYFVGLSDPMDSERMAREQAMRDARLQTVRFLGESLSTGTIQQSSVGGDIRGLSVKLEDKSFLEVAASGVASFVKDESWYVTEEPSPRGLYYKVKVLAYLPQSQYETAAATIVQAAKAE